MMPLRRVQDDRALYKIVVESCITFRVRRRAEHVDPRPEGQRWTSLS